MGNPAHLLEVGLLLLAAFLVGAVLGTLARLAFSAPIRRRPSLTKPQFASPVTSETVAAPLPSVAAVEVATPVSGDTQGAAPEFIVTMLDAETAAPEEATATELPPAVATAPELVPSAAAMEAVPVGPPSLFSEVPQPQPPAPHVAEVAPAVDAGATAPPEGDLPTRPQTPTRSAEIYVLRPAAQALAGPVTLDGFLPAPAKLQRQVTRIPTVPAAEVSEAVPVMSEDLAASGTVIEGVEAPEPEVRQAEAPAGLAVPGEELELAGTPADAEQSPQLATDDVLPAVVAIDVTEPETEPPVATVEATASLPVELEVAATGAVPEMPVAAEADLAPPPVAELGAEQATEPVSLPGVDAVIVAESMIDADAEVRDAAPADGSALDGTERPEGLAEEPLVEEDDEAAAMRAIEGNWTPRAAVQPRHRAELPEGVSEALVASSAAVQAAVLAARAIVDGARDAAPDAADAPDDGAAEAAAEVNPAEAPGTEAVDAEEPTPVEDAPTPAPVEPGRPEALSAPRGGRKDDLTHIIGVLPALELALNEIGVFHFDQIADWDEDNMVWVEDHLDTDGRVRREHWREQARELAATFPPRAAEA